MDLSSLWVTRVGNDQPACQLTHLEPRAINHLGDKLFHAPPLALLYIDSMAGDLFLEEESDVRRYRLIFEHLRAVSASPDASRVLAASLVTEM